MDESPSYYDLVHLCVPPQDDEIKSPEPESSSQLAPMSSISGDDFGNAPLLKDVPDDVFQV